MNRLEKWIWLDDNIYPQCQKTKISGFLTNDDDLLTVAEFSKTYIFGKEIKELKIRFSGDTTYQLYLNGDFLAIGPTPVAGDFIGNNLTRGQHYSNELTLNPNTNKLDFFARVKLRPVGIGEYSKGQGGFMLTGHITFNDGTQKIICTDETWKVRRNGAFVRPFYYDTTIKPDEYTQAKVIANVWHTTTSPLKNKTEEIVKPVGENLISVLPGEEKEVIIEYDKIYAGFVSLDVKTVGKLSFDVMCFENDPKNNTRESFVFDCDGTYRGFQMHSIGGFYVKLKNESTEKATVKVDAIACCYPVFVYAKTNTSDKELDKVLEVCAHTLKYCRQHIHLDSPRHCEPLACTGDYYIESLMTAFSFGDFDLAKFDVLRTAELLRNNNGRMFHTTYSLIWVLMLYDMYLYTADIEMLKECSDALMLLLNLFDTYVGDNGLIENPPDYMFIDWLYIDEISMHHPPKALGQTCLNMFYYGALNTACKIYKLLDLDNMAEDCIRKSESLKNAINTLLYDKEKQLYFDGLNTPTPDDLLGKWMPQNTSKRYYLKHSNILAVYFGVCDEDTSKMLIDKIMTEKFVADCQPYFKHFLLEAVYKTGLRDKYTLKIVDMWKPFVKECDKGLVEGFIPPEPTYPFDYSHAWGGTPLYSVPKALTGLEIVEAGYKKIKLNPSLLGLENATVQVPTPYGMITVKQKKGMKAVCDIPKEIEVVFKKT